MKILFISDTHNSYPSLYEEFDAVFHIGDATNHGSKTEFELFNRWWKYSISAKYKIFIPGNHEVHYFKTIQNFGLEKTNEIFGLTDSGVITLINQSIEINGIKFYGSPNTKPVREKIFWAWEECEESRKKIFSSIPSTDFLLTHTPPSKILSFNFKREDCGCPILLEELKRIKPKYHIFGHIHENGGDSLEKNGIKFFNVAKKYLILNLNEKKVTTVL